jgi:hypothetical protein
MADFIAEKRREAESRLKELKPAHDEYIQLQEFLKLLDQSAGPRRGPGRPRGSGAGSGKGRRRRRRRGGGSWADKALEVVRQNPGITVAEVGDKLGMKQKNYLYRVMNGLADDGAVRKEGKGYTAA